MAALVEEPAHRRRMRPDLNGDARRPLGAKSALERFGGSAQPALFDDLAAFGVDEAEMAILVAKIQSGCHLWVLPATIVHGPIPPSIEPYGARTYCRPKGYCARIGLLIPICDGPFRRRKLL